MPRAHGDAGSGVPGTRWSARTIGADRARGGSPGGRPPGGRRCHSMTAPAHRVGDLRDRPPAPGPAPMVDPPVWWRISRAYQSPAYKAMIIESNPPRPPPAHGAAGRGVKRAGPHPGGTTGLEGAHLGVDGPGSWSRPRALAAGRCRRLSLLIAQVLGQLGPQAAPPEPPRGRAGSSPRAPAITGLSGVDLLEQTVQGPGLAQPPSHIAPVDGLVPLLSRPQSASVLPSGLTQTIEHAPPSGPCRGLPPSARGRTDAAGADPRPRMRIRLCVRSLRDGDALALSARNGFFVRPGPSRLGVPPFFRGGTPSHPAPAGRERKRSVPPLPPRQP